MFLFENMIFKYYILYFEIKNQNLNKCVIKRKIYE